MRSNESIERLDAAVRALGDVDLAGWSDATLRGHLDELSAALCRVDGQLSRLADAVRARGFRVEEVVEVAPAVARHATGPRHGKRAGITLVA